MLPPKRSRGVITTSNNLGPQEVRCLICVVFIWDSPAEVESSPNIETLGLQPLNPFAESGGALFALTPIHSGGSACLRTQPVEFIGRSC